MLYVNSISIKNTYIQFKLYMFTFEPPKSSQRTSPHTFDTMTGILVSASLCTCTNIALDAHVPQRIEHKWQ